MAPSHTNMDDTASPVAAGFDESGWVRGVTLLGSDADVEHLRKIRTGSEDWGIAFEEDNKRSVLVGSMIEKANNDGDAHTAATSLLESLHSAMLLDGQELDLQTGAVLTRGPNGQLSATVFFTSTCAAMSAGEVRVSINGREPERPTARRAAAFQTCKPLADAVKLFAEAKAASRSNEGEAWRLLAMSVEAIYCFDGMKEKSFEKTYPDWYRDLKAIKGSAQPDRHYESPANRTMPIAGALDRARTVISAVADKVSNALEALKA